MKTKIKYIDVSFSNKVPRAWCIFIHREDGDGNTRVKNYFRDANKTKDVARAWKMQLKLSQGEPL